MIKIIHTDASHPDFRKLVAQLDSELAIIDGDDHDFYHQYNGIEDIKYALVLYYEDQPVSCGAIKPFDDNSMEVKRMYTLPDARGLGYASKILSGLEEWANKLGFTYCILETGKRQADAVALYNKRNYDIIPNYGPYTNVKNSVCFRKKVSLK
ncbi:MAG: GNAT family N-acetyltransferase [Saprospiraceae bacterium]|nr:GNAT family N-acetyltransferase [Saprospiraceae bacterium]